MIENSNKVVLLGETSVGKTSIMNRIIYGCFGEYNGPTIGAAFFSKKFKYNNGLIKLDFWDTAGHERYNSLVPIYYKHAKVIIFVVDISSINKYNESIQKVKFYLHQIKKYRECDNSKIILVGNKVDLILKDEENKNYIINNIKILTNNNPKINKFLIISAKNNIFIKELINNILILIENYNKNNNNRKNYDKIILNKKENYFNNCVC